MQSITLPRTTRSPKAIESHRESADQNDGIEVIADELQPSQVTREDDENKQQEKDNVVYVCKNAEELVLMRRDGTIQRLPKITEKEILAKSKGDIFVKGIAIVQVLWLILQVISRGAKGLPISQLEIAVLAYSACGVLTYALLWYKPQNVGTPIYVKEPLRSGATHDIRGVQSFLWFRYFTFLGGKIATWDFGDLLIPNDAFYIYGPISSIEQAENFSYINIRLVVGGAIFGGLHSFA
jgi:hypothetical protein